MWFRSLFDAKFAVSANNHAQERPSRRSKRPHFSPRRMRLCLEVLEDRTVPTVFNVGAGDVATLIEDMDFATNGSIDSTNVINLTKSTYDLTAINNYWYGPNGLPPIYHQNLIIHGNGAVIQRDPAAPAFRLFYVSGGLELVPGSLTLDNVTLKGGIAKGGDSTFGGGGLGAGGAIFNQGTLSLSDVTLTDNEALGGSSGVSFGTLSTPARGGGGMGGDAIPGSIFGPVSTTGDGGGFGGSVGILLGGSGGGVNATDVGGGGGGFVRGANGVNSGAGNGGGLGGFGGNGGSGGKGDDGGGGGAGNSIDGGDSNGNGGGSTSGSSSGGHSSSGGGTSNGSSSAPPTLQIPPLLAFLNSILGGVETVNGIGTETVMDGLFGMPLLVSTFDSAGHLVRVALFGLDITFLFG